jgi:hypothetical protein
LRSKRVHSLCCDLSRVSNLKRHRKATSFDARDIDQIADQAVHPSNRALNALNVPTNRLHGIRVRHFLPDERRRGAHNIQHISQVVAHDAEKIIPRS